MKEIHLLEKTNDLEFSVLAINSHDKGYKLCWHINTLLNMSFVRQDSSVLYEKEQFTSFVHYEGEQKYVLVENKSKKGFLLSKKKNINFFIKVEPMLTLKEKEEFTSNLNKVSKILLIFEIDLNKEKQAHRFIFND
jgi:hypothetical protein